MNALRIFENPEFGKIRTVEVDGFPWLVGKDVAQALGYQNTNKAMADHVDDEDKMQGDGVTIRAPLGRKQHPTIINESGLYSLVMSSKLPTARKFKRWVTSEVLPTVRKHGAYMTPDKLEEVLLKSDTLIQLAQNLKDEQEKRRALEAKVEQDRPKVVFAEAVETAHTSILVGELAKLLKQNGVDMGQQRLFQWLRDNGFLIKRKGTDYNMPTQYSMERGLMEIKERTVCDPTGVTRICQTGCVNDQGASGNASYGNCVKVKHPNGYSTLYAHLSAVTVKNGQSVKKGQQIGNMGNTGNSYGSHPHFEVRNTSDTCIDPAPYLAADLPGLKTETETEEKDMTEAEARKIAQNEIAKYFAALEKKPVSGWAQGHVDTVKKRGIMNGDTDGNFRPQDVITREEVAATLVNALGIGKEPSDWAKEAFEKATAAGIMDGTMPREALTREQFAVILDKLGLIP